MVVVVCVFLFFAIKTKREIDGQISASKEDKQYMAINESRRAAMRNVWLLLIWFILVTIESVSYNIEALIGDYNNCESRHFS